MTFDMTLEVEIRSLRRSAAAADSASTEAGKIELGAAVGAVNSALPGSESAVAVATLAEAWERRLNRWATDIEAFGSTVSAAADLYTRNERVAQQDIGNSILGLATRW
ncbi:hypothetical protein [Nocardia abscessus]|uniref:hypothetical protein n=1 Tax=Nocardia abscessus TaxID=120957 RepID=UPI002454AA85|nr:hypothetical protein [Nocardia abscessus]